MLPYEAIAMGSMQCRSLLSAPTLPNMTLTVLLSIRLVVTLTWPEESLQYLVGSVMVPLLQTTPQVVIRDGLVLTAMVIRRVVGPVRCDLTAPAQLGALSPTSRLLERTVEATQNPPLK